jgi:hypothetical protein
MVKFLWRGCKMIQGKYVPKLEIFFKKCKWWLHVKNPYLNLGAF